MVRPIAALVLLLPRTTDYYLDCFTDSEESVELVLALGRPFGWIFRRPKPAA